jgi:hypothetical protein
MRPIFGLEKASIKRVTDELSAALGFGSNIIAAEVNGSNVMVQFELNPQWHFLPHDRVKYLKKYLPGTIRCTFKVINVFEANHNQATGEHSLSFKPDGTNM